MRFFGRISYITSEIFHSDNQPHELNQVKSQKRLLLLMCWNFLVAQTILQCLKSYKKRGRSSTCDWNIDLEFHCFHELFLKASSSVVVFPRDLMQYCNAILLVLRFTRSLSNSCLFMDQGFQSPRVICVDKSFLNDFCILNACLTNSLMRRSIRNFNIPPPGHTPGIWLCIVPGEGGIWTLPWKGGEFEPDLSLVLT